MRLTRTPVLHRQRRVRAFALLCAALVLPSAAPRTAGTQGGAPDYKNPRLSVERRVADLLGRMTLEEKVAQLVCLWEGRPVTAAPSGSSKYSGDFSPEKARQVLKDGMGQIARQREGKDPREAARFANALQKWLVEETRLGIPAIFHDEILQDRKSTRLNSSHLVISYAVFCL